MGASGLDIGSTAGPVWTSEFSAPTRGKGSEAEKQDGGWRVEASTSGWV